MAFMSFKVVQRARESAREWNELRCRPAVVRIVQARRSPTAHAHIADTNIHYKRVRALGANHLHASSSGRRIFDFTGLVPTIVPKCLRNMWMCCYVTKKTILRVSFWPRGCPWSSSSVPPWSVVWRLCC